jgi:hypothetical protein
MSYVEATLSAHERPAIVADFLSKLSPEESTDAQRVAEEIASQSPLASTVVVIPVAAHQEAPQIANTLHQYARQRPYSPFSVVLGLNAPAEKVNTPETQATVDEIEKARALHTHLDVRTFFKSYEQPVIGKIRRDLWNGVLQASTNHAQISGKESCLYLNQDIDLVSMWPGTIGAVQADYDDGDAGLVFPVTGMSVSHGRSEYHPNISMAVAWNDYLLRAEGATFEAGYIIPAEMYALFSGFDPAATKSEILTRAKVPHFIIGGAYAVTSPRRYHEKIHTQGFDIWDKNDFSANDDCRVNDGYPDLEYEQAMQLIDDSLSPAADALRKAIVIEVATGFLGIKNEEPNEFKNLMRADKLVERVLIRQLERRKRVSIRVLHKLTKNPVQAAKFLHYLDTDYQKLAEGVRQELLDEPEEIQAAA